MGKTKFMVITGGLDPLDANETKSRKVSVFLPKDAQAIALKCHQFNDSNGQGFLVKEHFLNNNKVKDDFSAVVKLENEKETVENLKNAFFAVQKQRKPDFLLIETPLDPGKEMNGLIFKAVKKLEEEIGQENMLFVHINSSPELHLNGLAEEEMKKSTLLLNRLNWKPNLVINGVEATWIQ